MRVVVLGASLQPGKRSLSMVRKLVKADYEVFPIGRDEGIIEGVKIITDKPIIKKVHTVIMYLRSEYQGEYYDYIINTLKPKRIIFNKKTENESLMEMADDAGIEVLEKCSLVMLAKDEL